MPSSKESSREREAKRILDAASVQSDITGSSLYERSLQKASNHLNAADKEDEDWIEQTGTKIGRWVSLVLFIGLILWLASYFLPTA